MAGDVLVTGATGKVGHLVVAAMEARGLRVVRGTRRPSSASELWFDWSDPSSWPSALDGARSVYLVKPERDPGPTFERFLDSAHAVSHVVMLSEIAREQRGPTDSDRRAELAVEGGPWHWTILRPSWFFQNWGPGGGWGEEVRTTGEIRLASGDAVLSLVDARDVAEVATVALESDVGLGGLTLTGTEQLTMSDYAAGVTVVSGREVRHVSRSLEEERRALAAAGTDPRRVDFYLGLLTDIVEGRAATLSDDVARVLGKPPRTLRDYLEENAAYWSHHP